MASLLGSYSQGKGGRPSVNLMLPISKKLIPGEVQIKSGVMSLRRAGFPSQPPVPCVPSAEICYVPCLCLNQVQTDLGQGSGGGTGATCCSSAALQSYFRLRRSLTVAFKDTLSVSVVEICTDPPKPLPREARRMAAQQGQAQALLPQPGIIRLQPGSLRASWSQTWMGSATYRGPPSRRHRSRPGMRPEPPGAPRGLASGPAGGETRSCGRCPGQAFVLLPLPCGHEFSFLPGLSAV